MAQAPQVVADGDDAAAGTASGITTSAAAAPASSLGSQPLSLPPQTGTGLEHPSARFVICSASPELLHVQSRRKPACQWEARRPLQV